MADNELGLRYWQSGRITRRRFLGGVAVAGAGAAAIGLVGCSSGKKSGGSSQTPGASGTARVNDGTQDGAPTHLGGILRVRQNPALPSMNVFGPGIFPLAQGLFLGFTTFDHMWYVPTDTGQVELFLATKVEQPDATTVIATLGDATFHDKDPVNGRAVKASDVVASFKRFREEVGIGFDFLHNVMDDIVATDDKTVKITMKFPWAWVFTSSNAGSPIYSSIMPEEILHGHDDLLQKDAIGSGHWVLDSHENGANIKLRKFQQFRTYQNGKSIAGQPYLDGVDFKLITDDNAALAAFRANEIDSTGFSNRKQMEDTISALGDRIRTSSDLSRDYMCLMIRYDPPFNDVRVRQAFNLLIDRQKAIDLLEDGDAVKCGPVPPAHKLYALTEDSDDVMKEYFRHDVKDARDLLTAASWDFDSEWTMRHSNRQGDSDLAQFLQAQLGEGGVKINLEQQDLVKWFSQTLNQSDFKLTCFQHLPYEDPDLPLRFYLGPGDGRTDNFMRYQDDTVDAAILAAAKELDEDARIEKTKEAQRAVMRAYAPMFNIFSQISFGGSYSYVKGQITGRGSYGLFNRTTWLDKA
ncbi:MAG TPA: ABC transporter substrate-binding protein [Dehalococcoidia bacterium]|nr:ABC transporter substrate-binding protein [Dehalococcoidia bacterium]